MDKEIKVEDKEIIEKIHQNKNEGFELLVKKYQSSVLNIAYSLIRNKNEAEDIAQEVFIKAYKNIESFRRLSKISTWLYRITVNSSYDFLRKRKKYISLDLLPPIKTISHSYKTNLQKEEIKEIIHKAIEKLPFKYKTVLVLKEIENLSYQDIAKTLKCRIGTVESRLFRARKILKNILKALIDNNTKL